MHNSSRFVIYLLILVGDLFAQQAASPTAYSESNSYNPRQVSQTAKSQKNKAYDPSDVAPGVTGSEPARMRVSVLDSDRKPVRALTKQDFKLFVDGQETEIASVESSGGPVNFVFLIDNSFSAVATILDLSDRVGRVIDSLGTGDRALAIVFSEKFKIVCELTEDREKLKRSVGGALKNPESGTSIYDHVQTLSNTIIPKISHPVAVIVFTDGADTTSRKADFEGSLAAVEKSTTSYYVVYLDTLAATLKGVETLKRNMANFPLPGFLGRQTDPKVIRQDYETGLNYLNDLMSLSGGHLMRDASTPGTNVMLASEVPAEIRSQYVITFNPPSSGQASQRHQVKVRVSRPNLAVIARGSFIWN